MFVLSLVLYGPIRISSTHIAPRAVRLTSNITQNVTTISNNLPFTQQLFEETESQETMQNASTI
ncbi:hypothetical protein FF38_13719 [Lucilia cuprina]|uniref:Uncharacterized protein n=1 Tax=Lucilia cuprina TaxID=7375 RepID=A0A0L0CKH0_LUCCU|nr:hypothetical protein FF38_13719 [Lucilia cuprina]